MDTQIIVPLGLQEGDEAKINAEVARVLNTFNTSVQNAHSQFIASIKESQVLPEDVKTALLEEYQETDTTVKQSVTIIDAGRQATMQDAKAIFGDQYFGPETIAGIFKKVAVKTDIVKLPFTVKLLENAAWANCSLTYQPSYKDGNVIGLNQFAEICEGLQQKPDGNLLHIEQFQWDKKPKVLDSAWFSEKKYSEYRNQQVINPNCFRLATNDVLPGTANLKFVDQMLALCDWIIPNIIKSSVIPKNVADAIRNFRTDAKELSNLQDNDSAAFLQKIPNYAVWDMFMETGLETLLRMTAYNQSTGNLIFPDFNMGTRNKVTEPVSASLGGSGRWYSNGPNLSRDWARRRSSYLGLVFSCTELMK